VPLYEYQCSNCGHRFERIVKFSDAPIRTCLQCGKETAEQLISAPAVQFKGEGWYVTDYARKKSNPSSGNSDKKIDASAEQKSDSKSESKSESKPDSGSSGKSESATSQSTPKPSSDSKNK
jgi:putative FmdB family regulatory protein